MLERMYGLTPAEDIQAEQPDVPDLAITIVEATEDYGRFAAEPLQRGWGTTLGNALRRVLLSSLSGAAVTWVKIDNVLHEYTTLPHMREGIGEFLLNVKGIRLQSHVDHTGRLRLDVDGEAEVRAGDIMPSADFDVVNPELHLATLDSSQARLSVEFNIEQGQGYVPASHEEGLPIGVMPVDAIYSPVRKASFNVENNRIGQRSDLERLVIEVWTDGTISPAEAVKRAADLLIDHMFVFKNCNRELSDADGPAFSAGVTPAVYNTLVEALDLSARTLNCLKRAGINRVGEVLLMPKSELLKIKNFGQKSLSELYVKMGEKGCLPQEPEVSEEVIPSEQSVQAEPVIDSTDDSNTGV